MTYLDWAPLTINANSDSKPILVYQLTRKTFLRFTDTTIKKRKNVTTSPDYYNPR